jgi:hypothetical protein
MGWGWGWRRNTPTAWVEEGLDGLGGVTVFDPPRPPVRVPGELRDELVFWDRTLRLDGCRRCTHDTSQRCAPCNPHSHTNP